MARNVNELGPLMNYPSGGTSPYRLYTKSGFQTAVSRQRPKDLLANSTSLTASLNETRSSYVYVPFYRAWYPIGIAGGASANTSIYSSLQKSAKDQAATKLRMRLKDQTWNAAQTFAELGKTMSFFVEASRDLIVAYRLAKRGDILGLSEFYRRYDMRGKRRKPPYQRVSERWLQWRYAVRPLAFDMEDMLAEFYRSDLKPVVQKFTGKGEAQTAGTREDFVTLGYPSYTDFQAKARSRYISYVTLNPDQASFKRLGLINAPALLWELLPGSFLLDWWCPVGDYLSGLDAAVGVSNKVTTHSASIEVIENFNWCGGKQFARTQEFQRLVTGIPSQPLPRLRTSQYDLKNRVLDVIALCTQVVTNRRGR